ncbi:MAG: hypothetical protein PHE24_06500 [Patescibacteria group bacterium]|nr:hypothetical protein [Patescibacteria group bacterium]
MKNIWSAIFSKAVVDSTTNSLSLFDCIDEITVKFANAEDLSKPSKNIPIVLTIISLWVDENVANKRKFDYTIEIIDPQNKKIGEFSSSPIFEEGKKRLRTITQTNGMQLTSEGEYIIVVKYKMESEKFNVASKIPVDVKFILSAPIKKVESK